MRTVKVVGQTASLRRLLPCEGAAVRDLGSWLELAPSTRWAAQLELKEGRAW